MELVDARTGLVHDYTRKGGVEHTEILTPDGLGAERNGLWDAAELAEKATGVPLLPHMTVREYLAALLGKLKGFEHFRAISSLLERHLYAGARDPGDQGRAEAELEAMRREDEA
ncbi:MAG: MobA/MobL family protein [Nitrososphaerota archaeon]|nr:MobA/MobL family protein [Nitrososphaerota archaeon]